MSEINQTKTDYEIDLLDLLRTLWIGKWVIIIVTAISILVAYVYANSIPKKYKTTTEINHADTSVFIKYSVINEILKNDDITAAIGPNEYNLYVLNPSRVFHKARIEFNNYQEVANVLENYTSIKKDPFEGTNAQKRDLLFDLATSFNFSTPTKQGEKYTVSFIWENTEEGRKIFESSMVNVLENVRKSVIKDINSLANLIEKNNQRKIDTFNLKIDFLKKAQKKIDMVRVEYLKEQSKIAKEIDLEYSIKDLSLAKSKQSLLQESGLDTNSVKNKSLIDLIEVPFLEVPYFLLGYKAIDKEIELILNREDEQRVLKTDEYVKVMHKLIQAESDLSAQILRQSISILENENVNDWIKYDFSLGNTKSLNNSRFYIMVSIIFGLTFGAVFVLISHYFRKNSKSI